MTHDLIYLDLITSFLGFLFLADKPEDPSEAAKKWMAWALWPVTFISFIVVGYSIRSRLKWLRKKWFAVSLHLCWEYMTKDKAVQRRKRKFRRMTTINKSDLERVEKELDRQAIENMDVSHRRDYVHASGKEAFLDTYIKEFVVVAPTNDMETVGERLTISMWGEYCPPKSLRGYNLGFLLAHPNNYQITKIVERGELQDKQFREQNIGKKLPWDEMNAEMDALAEKGN